MSYPQHEKFKAEREKMNAVEEFIEWFIRNGPTSVANECRVCGADDTVPLARMQDKQKGDLIMKCFGIDVDEFYAEKDRMYDDMRKENYGD